ncbi:MAG: helix-turn-helix domain-containing protein [Candidatus Binatus sp.]|uniref:IclR family transcriptional regulator n=1 Tax=Candidatus Binatus sp. TaxID=2811406 RepID=UPI002729324B|nr:helix-turn-helix domain-containing protein [Candidatus Binatus sp.]MDO8431889.1 helix-turn-helix domain-containing protein [Candidatus Binatus sp.]
MIDRVLALLEILAANGPAMTLAELARRVELPKSTALRLLAVLQRHRFVERESSTGDYRLGLKLFELGSQAAAQFDFGDRAQPYLDRLMSSTGESVFLSVLDGADVRGEPLDCGHFIPEEAPEALADRLLAFFGDTAIR